MPAGRELETPDRVAPKPGASSRYLRTPVDVRGRMPPALSPATVLGLQRSAGNTVVGGLVSRRPPMTVQRAKLEDYADSDPLHDASRVTDAAIEATDEYQAYMAMNPVPVPLRPVTADEARQACRLLLRTLRQAPGPFVVTKAELQHYLDLARGRDAVTATAEGTVGKQQWVAVTPGDVSKPSAAHSDFLKWMLAGGSAPNPATGKLNCWEMVLFSAYRAGHVTEKRMRDLYTTAKAAMTASGDVMAFPRTLEKNLTSSAVQTYDPGKKDSARPLRGDLVIFDELAGHVALATGRMTNGKAEVISHWPPPDGSYNAKRTTIEDLLPAAQVKVAKFWAPPW